MTRFPSPQLHRMLLATMFLVAAGSLLTLGCQRPPPVPDKKAETGPVWFEDITEKVGLKFVHDAGRIGSYQMPQQVGSGAALFDFDGDLYGKKISLEFVERLRDEVKFDSLEALVVQIGRDVLQVRQVIRV